MNLHEKIKQREIKRAELLAESEKCEDIERVKAINGELRTLKDELSQLYELAAELEKAGADRRSELPTAPHGFDPIAAYSTEKRHEITPKKQDLTETPEYREAFMNYVCRGTPIPAELRAVTTTADASAVIPTTLMDEIVKKMEVYGELFNRVRKTNLQGGVNYPILTLKPTASWVGETTSSTDQKLTANTSVNFSFYMLECKIAQSLLSSIVTYDAFQREFPILTTEAIVKALDVAIIKGTGSGQATGITVDARVPAGNIITLADNDFTSWQGWKRNVFAKMKEGYRDGIFAMAQGTFDGYIDGMVDTAGQPIGRINYGIDGAETYRFGGREIITVEDDVIINYEDAAAGDIVAVFFNPNDYAFNSNLTLTVTSWDDNDNNQKKNKALMVVDGKLIDPNGVLIIKKEGEG